MSLAEDLTVQKLYLGRSKQELDKLQTLFLVVLHFRVLLVAGVLSNLGRDVRNDIHKSLTVTESNVWKL